MYYKFGGFTQRLVGAGAPAAYSPQVMRILLPSDRRVDLHGFIPLQAKDLPTCAYEAHFSLGTGERERRGAGGAMPYERMPKGSAGARGLPSVADSGEVALATEKRNCPVSGCSCGTRSNRRSGAHGLDLVLLERGAPNFHAL